MKIIAWLAGIGTPLTATGYMVVSLNRWEWNRALFFGLIVLIAEVGLATGLILRKLNQLLATARARRRRHRPRRPAAVARPVRLDEARSAGQLDVFITFLVGGGVILSGLAWLVDRVAAAHRHARRWSTKLVGRMAAISYPRGGLLVDDVTALAQDVPGADDQQIPQAARHGPGATMKRVGQLALAASGSSWASIGGARPQGGDALDPPQGHRGGPHRRSCYEAGPRRGAPPDASTRPWRPSLVGLPARGQLRPRGRPAPDRRRPLPRRASCPRSTRATGASSAAA